MKEKADAFHITTPHINWLTVLKEILWKVFTILKHWNIEVWLKPLLTAGGYVILMQAKAKDQMKYSHSIKSSKIVTCGTEKVVKHIFRGRRGGWKVFGGLKGGSPPINFVASSGSDSESCVEFYADSNTESDTDWEEACGGPHIRPKSIPITLGRVCGQSSSRCYFPPLQI